MNWTDKIQVTNEDCMDLMARCPDNYFDLAIVDPPYGIGFDGQRESTSSHGGRKAHQFKGWDKKRPTSNYFYELMRVSIDQIIWGGNYFVNELKPSMGWIFWDKGQRICNSDGELAFTTFSRALRVVEINRNKISQGGGSIHPTQKPIKLYEWLLNNYAKPGQKILDTHLGSGSHAIACHNLGYELTACELDKDYYEASYKRFKAVTSQLRIQL